ncbi:MAG: hypothetical protein ACK6AD_03165 [Cyanobacteriota bacterium]|jgi:hypothetical protein
MNHLRKIMQKLAQAQPDASRHPDMSSATSTEIMRLHVEEYQRELARCTAAMLQYEWAWLDDYITSLNLCLAQPDMLQAAGGKSHVEQLLLESQQCQALLQATMKNRKVEPASPSHAVAIGEHAWELRQESIKRLWGLN